jgi:hypothetical protein
LANKRARIAWAHGATGGLQRGIESLDLYKSAFDLSDMSDAMDFGTGCRSLNLI